MTVYKMTVYKMTVYKMTEYKMIVYKIIQKQFKIDYRYLLLWKHSLLYL